MSKVSTTYSKVSVAKASVAKASVAKASAPVKKFCKVCFDLKKTKEEYESHYVRENPDPSSKVTCPVLLSLECTFCSKPGHTVGYCKELAHKKKEDEKRKRMELQKEKPPLEPVKKQRPSNPFAALCDDSSDSETEQKQTQNQKQKKDKKTPLVLSASVPSTTPGKITAEDFPQLTTSKTQTSKPVTMSYLSIASQVYQENEKSRLEKEEAELLARLAEINKQKEQQEEKPKPKPKPKAVFLPSTKAKAPSPKPVQLIQELAPAPAPITRYVSLFDRSEYLDISDNEDEQEPEQTTTYQYAKKCVIFNADELDEDW